MKHSMVDSIVAAALGAAAMYYFDPESGRRRRAMLGDQLVSRRHEAEHFLRSRARWTSDRLRGLAVEARSAVTSANVPVSDQRIRERVRAAIGRVVSTPGAIDVDVAAGTVLLSGHILAPEREGLLAAVSAVKGVENVSDQLEEYDDPGNVPELQGATKI